ncbi:MAG: Glu-tRNA(Gln) amidotransferase subunit GatE [Candidatus Heimdallarchaeota archaeon]|nr:Glu-tRNA(Gln) amidotransferase subunit GatE [Candidatus Heimdallarchaeota archaeon]
MDFDIKAPTSIDYEKEGTIIGLEFHQQVYAPYGDDPLNKIHGGKLFCSCPAYLRDDDAHFTIKRRFRAMAGETGDIDITAQFEKQKQGTTIYEAFHDTTCLVELDEEPISPINEQALFRTLAMARKLFGLELVDEILISRKTIIDGSNTSGFQRTALVAYEGQNSFIDVNGKKIGIYQANLEEDSAKNMGKEGSIRSYRLDRLGIPLIEIATKPDMRTPEEGLATAMRIGELLRTTGFVRRGQGTIRQDLNVSIKRGTRIEIKGVSDLDLLTSYINNECIRQVRMLDLLQIVSERGITSKLINKIKAKDVTKVFKKSEAKFVKTAIKKKHKVIGAKLPNFKGLIGYELQPDYRVGTEFSEISKVTAGAGGILHSDELPKFGISQEEVDNTRDLLKLGENDGFILIIGPKDIGLRAVDGIKMAITMWIETDGLIPEVRSPRANGTTGYLRPLPGKARMYPETDAKPIAIKHLLPKIEKLEFEMPEDRMKRYMKKLKLSEELAQQLAIHPQNDFFEDLVSDHKIDPTIVANTLLSTIINLRRDGLDVDKIYDEDYHDMFEAIAGNIISKASIDQLLSAIAQSEKRVSVSEHIKNLGIKMIDEDEVRKIINDVIDENASFLERGMGAMGPMMGKAMKALSGKADGKLVSRIVKEEITKRV